MRHEGLVASCAGVDLKGPPRGSEINSSSNIVPVAFRDNMCCAFDPFRATIVGAGGNMISSLCRCSLLRLTCLSALVSLADCVVGGGCWAGVAGGGFGGGGAAFGTKPNTSFGSSSSFGLGGGTGFGSPTAAPGTLSFGGSKSKSPPSAFGSVPAFGAGGGGFGSTTPTNSFGAAGAIECARACVEVSLQTMRVPRLALEGRLRRAQ